MADKLLPSFLIPEKKETNTQKMEKCIQEKEREIYQKLDSTWTIAEQKDVFELNFQEFKEELFHLWIKDLIYWRMKFFEWDRFQQTIKAPLVLKPGTPENLNMIKKFDSSKIVNLLDFIGEGISYPKLVQSFNITRTKLNMFLEELRRQHLIRKIQIIKHKGYI